MTDSNTLRARQGERPTCWNRPDYPDWVEVQRGMEPVTFATPDGKTGTVFAPAFDLVRNPMSRDCKAWAVRAPDPDRPGDTGENPATESVPGAERWRCHGCRHLPSDPRIQLRAQQSEDHT